MLQAASICEMTSITPVAGAQYHWTSAFAPGSLKGFAAWLQGWVTWFGYISIEAGMANVTMIFLQSIVQLNHPDFVPGGWKTAVLVILMFAFLAALNIYGFPFVPYIEMVAGVLHIVLFLIIFILLLVSGTRNSGGFWLSTNSSSGWPDGFVSWNLGLVTSVWAFTGLDGAAHMSEDTRRASSAVPRAIFWSILVNGLLGFAMVNALILAMGSLEQVLAGGNPIITILLRTTTSKRATTVLMSMFSIINFSCNIANVASVSRLTHAWARDKGLPAYFSVIDPKRNVPVRAVCLAVFVPCLLCLLNLGNAPFVAFGALTSLSSISLYTSYAIAIASMLYSRFTGKIVRGEWNLGRYGACINVFALIFTLYVMVFLPFPSTLPVTAANMNYCGPLMLFVLVVVVVYWFASARKAWKRLDDSIAARVIEIDKH
ncbi:amino acid permease [Fusarium heterosporum]|uniref:Amino acid permease n=1 Tax=Fusarium heterosporum TaxID=42747 RepID=A0A8H5SV27_FUSHE|nr:amino acid permease [Fusarium heterosporum]